MNRVCVITGGGSGMGLATARYMGKDHYVFLVGRTARKLENALDDLRKQGINAEAISCDVSDRDSVRNLALAASQKGTVKAVIHAAGMSPHMGEPEAIMAANALGTVYVNEEFYKVMNDGGCIIDVSSMSAHITPKFIMPTKAYSYSRIDDKEFMSKMMKRVNLFPKKARAGVAYGISKNFVVWYAKTDAQKMGEKNIRVLSVSPGNFETSMGEMEKNEADAYTKHCAIKRFGHVDEIASLFAFCASDQPGYLTGVDIICDGGLVASGINPLKMK